MNEAAMVSLEFVLWAGGILLAIIGALVGLIHRHDQKQHDGLAARIKWMEEYHVRSETLERIERTWADAIKAMTDQRREMHKENKDSLSKIEASITGIHRRIDAEFRHRRHHDGNDPG